MTGKQIGPYRVIGVVGRGGMGVVYRVRAPDDRTFALKVMAPELARDDEFRERFIRESSVQLGHPNVIEIFDAGMDGDALYLAMHLVDGRDLKSVIASEGRLLPARVLAIMKQACAALDAAHQNAIVHRDIKPQNFLLESANGTEHVYLSDFGLVKSVTSQSSLTASAHLMGTAQYMSPEQIKNRPIDGRADIYSLGCVLYECLTGTVPYERREEVSVLFSHVTDPPPKVSEKVPVLPAALDDVVAKAMAKDPRDRYLTAGDLAVDLEATLVGRASRKALWGDLEIHTASREGAPKGPRAGKEFATAATAATAATGPHGGITGWLIAVISLIITVTVLTSGDARSPVGGPIADVLDRLGGDESPLEQRANDRDRGPKTEAKQNSDAIEKSARAGDGRARLIVVDQAPSNESDGTPATRAQTDISHPPPGAYVFEQTGREAICPPNAGCSEGADLPDTAETRVTEVGSTSATDEVASTRISDRFSMATFLVYRPRGVFVQESVMSFRTSQGGFEVRLRPQPFMELLGSPLDPGQRWRGSWISEPTSGSYAVEVLARDHSAVGGRRFETVRVKTVVRWTGTHAGTLEMTSWIDPDTRATLESVVQVRAKTGQGDDYYEATFHHVLTRGPGYPR